MNALGLPENHETPSIPSEPTILQGGPLNIGVKDRVQLHVYIFATFNKSVHVYFPSRPYLKGHLVYYTVL